MTKTHGVFETEGVRERSARIRAGWSELERLRRSGLPPDIPWRLRQELLAIHAFARQNWRPVQMREMQALAAVSNN